MELSLDEEIMCFEQDFISFKNRCEYNDLKYSQGLIPITTTPYLPNVLPNVLLSENAKKLQEILENNSLINFNEEFFEFESKIIYPILEICSLPNYLKDFIENYGVNQLILDRKGFDFIGNYNKNNLGWYAKKNKNKIN